MRHLESCNGATNEYDLMVFFDMRKIRIETTYRAEREQWAGEWVYSSSGGDVISGALCNIKDQHGMKICIMISEKGGAQKDSYSLV